MLTGKHLLAWYLSAERNLDPCARVHFKVQCALICAEAAGRRHQVYTVR